MISPNFIIKKEVEPNVFAFVNRVFSPDRVRLCRFCVTLGDLMMMEKQLSLSWLLVIGKFCIYLHSISKKANDKLFI